MSLIDCYVAIGSNLDRPVDKARTAVRALAELQGSELVRVSSLYSSKPMGPADQPDYINAVALIRTALAPLALLDALQAIELEHGRVRKENRWGPRTLDLDILLYGDHVIDTPRLTVPHYGMKVREFVLYPLQEIAPDLVLPDGESLINLVDNCSLNGLAVYSDH